MKKINKILSLILLLTLGDSTTYNSYAQNVDSTSFYAPIELDETVVTAIRGGFNVENFIKIIQNDTTFYKAFKTLHITSYNAQHQVNIRKEGTSKLIASLNAETRQQYYNQCRTMNVLEENITGDYYKKGKPNYFTAQLYESLFYEKGKRCNENNIVGQGIETELNGKNKIEKSKIQLKILLFNPGKRINGIPFVGKKVAIFEPEIAKMYDFSLSSEVINGQDCYVFEAVPKQKFKNDVVINTFKTWFRTNDLSVIARNYSLSYSGIGYDFDVTMNVKMTESKGQLVPAQINYNGNWKIVTQKREKVDFQTKFYY